MHPAARPVEQNFLRLGAQMLVNVEHSAADEDA
jgi:hypothetical protein